MKLAVVIPDMHVPYHHRKATELVLKTIQKLKPDEIVFLGDVADFYAVSSHGRHPTLLHDLRLEVDQVNELLDVVSRFPGKKVFLEGNHCYRLERYLASQAPALFGVTQTSLLLKMDQRKNWTFVDYSPKQLYRILGSRLGARHEPLGATSKASAARALMSLVYGHIHRIESSYIVGLDQKQHINFSCGWLGDLKFDKVFNYVKGHHQWQLGFALVWVDEKTNIFYPQIIPIIENGKTVSCIVNGERISA